MASEDANTTQQQRSIFPSPPLFYTIYTPSQATELNDFLEIQHNKSYVKLIESNDLSEFPQALQNLPSGLQHWIPPPQPTAPFTKFSELQPPADQFLKFELPSNIPKLYKESGDPEHSDIAYAQELRQFNRNLLNAYTNIINALVGAVPAEWKPPQDPKAEYVRGLRSREALYVDDQLQQLTAIGFNMIQLLNLLRRHQARQTIIAKQQKQLTNVRAKIEHLKMLSSNAAQGLQDRGYSFEERDNSTAIV